jgi:hypothetical protein
MGAGRLRHTATVDVDETRAEFARARRVFFAATGRDGQPHLVPVTFAMPDTRTRWSSPTSQGPKWPRWLAPPCSAPSHDRETGSTGSWISTEPISHLAGSARRSVELPTLMSARVHKRTPERPPSQKGTAAFSSYWEAEIQGSRAALWRLSRISWKLRWRSPT